MSFLPENMLVLDSVDSTNNYAMALIQKGEMMTGNAVFALEQTNGKGRRGKHWESNSGSNIMISITTQMQWLSPSRQFELSVAVALGCYELFTKYILANVFIKWPNDLFIGDSKAGGLLIENILHGTLWQWSIIGIGLNINQEYFEEVNLKATSLKKETGKTYNVLKLGKQLHLIILDKIEELKRGNFDKMFEEYNEHLFARNKLVKLKKNNIVFETKIIGVSSSGQLITKDAFERSFNFDEVEFKGLA